MDESYLTQEELAKCWNVKVKTLQQWRWNGKGPVYTKIGRCIYYWLPDIKTYERSQRRRSTSGLPIGSAEESDVSDERPLPNSCQILPLRLKKKGGW